MNINLSQEKTVLVTVMATSFLAPFVGSSINLAIPAIGSELSGTTLELSWVVAIFLLTSAAFLLPLGRLADIIGRKKVYITGIILFTLFSAFCAFAVSMPVLIAFRAIQGIAAAMIFATGIAILTSVYPPARRGHALGVTASATYVGLSLGPVLGGFLCHYAGWRSIFYLTALISSIAALIAVWQLKGEWADAKGEKFNLTGSLHYIIALTAVLYSLSSLSSNPWSKFVLLLGLGLMALFIYFQHKRPFPLIKVDLFYRNTVFAFSNLAAMINYSATFAVGFLASLHLQVIMGYDSQISGLIMLAQPIMMAVFSPFAGTLSDRIEPRLVASAGMGLSTLGLFLFTFVNAATPVWLIITNLAFIGLGFALFSSPNNNAIMGSVEKNLYGVAASSLATMRLIGQAVSMAIVTLVISIHVGNLSLASSDTAMLAQGTRLSFIVFTVICIIGIFASMARGTRDD